MLAGADDARPLERPLVAPDARRARRSRILRESWDRPPRPVRRTTKAGSFHRLHARGRHQPVDVGEHAFTVLRAVGAVKQAGPHVDGARWALWG